MDPQFRIDVGESHDGFKLLLIVIAKELLNKNSFWGGAGLINAALNLVSYLFQFLFQFYAMIHVYVLH